MPYSFTIFTLSSITKIIYQQRQRYQIILIQKIYLFMQEIIGEPLPQLTCPSSNKARMLCTSSTCQLNSLICMKEDCQPCQNNHPNCQTHRLYPILQLLRGKRQRPDPEVLKAFQKIKLCLDEAIERISRDKDLTTDQLQLYGLNQHQATLYRLFKEQRLSEIVGNVSSPAVATIHQKIELNVTQESVIRYWNKKKKDFDRIFQGFKLLLKKKYIKFQSKVTDELAIIQGFFDKPIYEFNLLYRASEHNFQTSVFHSKCDNIPHTLILAKTQFGKIIGAYTPLKWCSSGVYVNDTLSPDKTFLFSITNNEKYTVINEAYTIYGNAGYGPAFGGGHDFYIANNSATAANTSYFNFPHSYNLNGKYISGQEAKTAFSGATSNQYARVMEWEVYQIDFV